MTPKHTKISHPDRQRQATESDLPVSEPSRSLGTGAECGCGSGGGEPGGVKVTIIHDMSESFTEGYVWAYNFVGQGAGNGLRCLWLR